MGGEINMSEFSRNISKRITEIKILAPSENHNLFESKNKRDRRKSVGFCGGQRNT